jgi:hypothetical protein
MGLNLCCIGVRKCGDVHTMGSSGPFSTLLHAEVDPNLTGTAVNLREAAGTIKEERTRLVNIAS